MTLTITKQGPLWYLTDATGKVLKANKAKSVVVTEGSRRIEAAKNVEKLFKAVPIKAAPAV